MPEFESQPDLSNTARPSSQYCNCTKCVENQSKIFTIYTYDLLPPQKCGIQISPSLVLEYVNYLKYNTSGWIRILLIVKYVKITGLGIRSSVFWANRSFFAQKWAIAIAHFLWATWANFWWVTWAICSHHSFLVSDLSYSLTKKEGMSDSLIFLNKKRIYSKKTHTKK